MGLRPALGCSRRWEMEEGKRGIGWVSGNGVQPPGTLRPHPTQLPHAIPAAMPPMIGRIIPQGRADSRTPSHQEGAEPRAQNDR